MTLWIREKNGGSLLKIHVNPRSSKEQVTGCHGDALNIRLTAPAVEGRANKALISFLAGFLGVKKRQVKIQSGDKSRNKLVSISGISPGEIEKMIESKTLT